MTSGTRSSSQTPFHDSTGPFLPGAGSRRPAQVLFHMRTRGTGPEGVHARGVIRALRAIGYSVRLVAPPGVDPERTAGESPYRQGEATRSWRLIALKAPAWIFDIVAIVYNAYAWTRLRQATRPTDQCAWIYERYAPFFFAGTIVSKRRGIPLLLEVNESVSMANVRRHSLRSVAGAVERAVFRRADALLVVSPQLREHALRQGIPRDRVHVIPNAVDEDRFTVPAGRRHEVRQALGLEHADVAIIFVGWFVPWHRLDLLLDSFAQLKALQLPLRLVLVGEGPLRSELESRAARLDIAHNVRFTGAVPFGEVAAHMAACDIGIIPFTSDYSSPIKLFEYLAAGLAVVAPDMPQLRSIVRTEVDAILVTPADARALGDAVGRLATDPALRRRLGERGPELVLTNHTWRRNAERIAGIAERLGRSRPGVATQRG